MGEKGADDLAGAVDLKDEQDIATDGSSLEPENEEDDLVSITDKAIILGLEGIIEELKYNNSNIDTLREEFNDFRDENEENFQKRREGMNKSEEAKIKADQRKSDDVSAIHRFLVLVFVILPLIGSFFVMVLNPFS